MNESNTIKPLYASNLFNTKLRELCFFSIAHSNKTLILINNFIKGKISKYQSKLKGSSSLSSYQAYDGLVKHHRIDYIDKLKSYYRSKYRKFDMNQLRLFTIQRKELKSEHQTIKNTSKGIILSLFIGVNGLFGFKRIELIKSTPQLFMNFFVLTGTMAITSNWLIQKKLDKRYQKQLNTLEKVNL